MTNFHQRQIQDDALLFNEQKQKELEKAGNEEVQIQTEIERIKLQTIKQSSEAQRTIQEANFAATKSFVDGVSGLFQILAANQEDATELARIAALAQIAIDTASAIATLVPTAVKVPSEAASVADQRHQPYTERCTHQPWHRALRP
ncbi:hypothetical protein QNI16_07790 [Cytophagaceae bacterium YF14B1]|uniref:Uncharacterized protein n=1 Tax=Xanthocytophaga flava TaxID=3048013 RepID=A0AAE3QKM9_9BACT|nr:hypothetical protein [Xanthocytophaga flavus]MDJ1480381.1 hypothetical protein [Xanthocytophaga flavus]